MEGWQGGREHDHHRLLALVAAHPDPVRLLGTARATVARQQAAAANAVVGGAEPAAAPAPVEPMRVFELELEYGRGGLLDAAAGGREPHVAAARVVHAVEGWQRGRE